MEKIGWLRSKPAFQAGFLHHPKKHFFLNKKYDRIGDESDKTPPPPAGTPPGEENLALRRCGIKFPSAEGQNKKRKGKKGEKP